MLFDSLASALRCKQPLHPPGYRQNMKSAVLSVGQQGMLDDKICVHAGVGASSSYFLRVNASAGQKVSVDPAKKILPSGGRGGGMHL